MTIIANLQYMTVSRMIMNNKQYYKEEIHNLTLSKERVITSEDAFLLDEVLDISYRFFSKEMGFIYLHTSKGLYSYTIKTSPLSFIEQFKRIK